MRFPNKTVNVKKREGIDMLPPSKFYISVSYMGVAYHFQAIPAFVLLQKERLKPLD